MFNEFESNDPLEREGKFQQRLQILKAAREAGYYDEKGSEAVSIVYDGANPVDPAPER